ncbi:MAG: hypothetical protein KF803_18675 [Cyclobacteriaceae bacterium]|nr:hypothetical protein [Cyclobacteriaceae bacterium]
MSSPIKKWSKEFDAMTKILLGDINTIQSQLDSKDSQDLRRSYARALFAYIEATNYLIREFVILFNDPDTETNKLLRKRKPLSESFELSLDTFAWTGYTDGYFPNKKSKHWNNFESTIKIRNRIVHPKSVKDLTITNREMTKIKGVFIWYCGQISDLFKKVSHGHQRMLIAMNDNWIKQKPKLKN